MDREQRLFFCRTCQNRKFDVSRGILCGLTDKEAAFEGKCPDYLKDPNVEHNTVTRYKKARKPISTRAILWISASVLFGVVLTILGWRYYQQKKEEAALRAVFEKFSEEDYRAYGNLLVSKIRSNDYRFINDQVDQEYLRSAILGGIYTDNKAEEMFQRDIFRPGKHIYRMSRCSDSHVELVRVYTKDILPHVMLRVACYDNIEYLDFTLGVNKGELRIHDYFQLSTGQSWSEDIDIVINEVGGIGYDEKSRKWSRGYRKMINRMQRIYSLLKSGNDKVAGTLLTEIPEQFQKYQSYDATRIWIASYRDGNTYDKVKDDVIKKHPNLKIVAAYHGVKNAIRELDSVRGIAYLNELDDFVGHDPKLQFQAAQIYLASGDRKRAEEIYLQQLEASPKSGYNNMVYLKHLIETDQYIAATNLLNVIRRDRIKTDAFLNTELNQYRDYLYSQDFRDHFDQTRYE